MANSRDFVSCMLYRIKFFVFERSVLCCIGYFVFQMSKRDTYVIGLYNPSVRIIDLVSHTTYVVCVNFIHKWLNLQFKVDSERQIFWETFQGNFIYSQSFCQNSAERKSSKKYFLYSVLTSSTPGTRTLYLRLISQHTT